MNIEYIREIKVRATALIPYSFRLEAIELCDICESLMMENANLRNDLSEDVCAERDAAIARAERSEAARDSLLEQVRKWEEYVTKLEEVKQP